MKTAQLGSWVVGLSLIASAAWADVGPQPRCYNTEGKGCVECSQHLGKSPEQQPEHKACVDGALARGLVETCSHRSGAVNQTYYCPSGARVSKGTLGCGGCAVGSAETSGLGALAAAAALAASRRRRRREVL